MLLQHRTRAAGPHSRHHRSRPRRLAASAAASEPDPPVRAILFDLDGTLASSEHLSRKSAAMVFKQLHGLDVQEEEFIPFGGMGEARFLSGVAEKYNVKAYDGEAAIAAFMHIYINTFAKPEMNIAYPGAVDLVRACRAAGLKTAVASSAGNAKVDANLAAGGFDAAADFDAVIGADGFDRIKPAPDIFLAAARQLGVQPSSCVVVEDAAAGVAAGRAAGMRVVGVTTCLTEAEMGALPSPPDLIRPSVTELTVGDLTAVRYSHQGRAASGGSQAAAAGAP